MPKIFKIKTSKHYYSIDEIRQSVELKFAWGNRQVDGSINLCHQFVKCKDFLHDFVWATINKKGIDDLFGICYNPYSDLPVTLYPSIYLAVKSENPTNLLKMKRSKKILNTFEQLEGLKPTKLFTCNNPKIMLFKSPPDWASSGIMISLYSFLIRVGAQISDFSTIEEMLAAIKNETKSPDSNYAKDICNHCVKLFTNRKKFDFNTFNLERWCSYDVHDGAGIISAINLYIPSIDPDYKQAIRELVKG